MSLLVRELRPEEHGRRTRLLMEQPRSQVYASPEFERFLADGEPSPKRVREAVGMAIASPEFQLY